MRYAPHPGQRSPRSVRLDAEVVNEEGTSTVWDDLFDTDRTACEAFHETLDRERIGAFLNDDGSNAILFPCGPLH
jgi:hypothetical protein